MIRKDLLHITKDYFKAQGIPSADADLLLAHLLGCNKGEVQLKLMKLDQEQEREVDRELRRLVLRRQNGEPTQYIIGSAPFRYLTLKVGPGVLIPRPESESLVELIKAAVLKKIESQSGENEIRIIDLGAGSGCISISLSTELTSAPQVIASQCAIKITAVEKSPEAFEWLMQNVVSYSADIRTILSDVKGLTASGGECENEHFDFVIANPPYIPDSELLPINVRYEPEAALFGGSPDGMAIPMEFIDAAARLLRSGGTLALEHHETQSTAIAQALETEFIGIESLKDLTGRERFTLAQRR